MNILFKGTNYTITPEIESLCTSKITSATRMLGADQEKALTEVELELVEERKNNNAVYRAEVNVSLDGKLYRAESTRRSMQNAISDVKKELSNEIRRDRGKDKSLMKQGGRAVKSFLRGFGR
ncbi:MAG: HPF/RaiA family ribosome-associated protein [Patescibacteria group bacterium UBA2103]